MAIEFCPLAEDVGNLADWVAVGVGVAATVATTTVAWLAYKTSEQAKEAAGEATRIAKQQHDSEISLRTENARIIGRLLLNEVSQVPIRVAAIYRAAHASIKWNGLAAIKSESALKYLLEEGGDPLFPGAEAVEERIHVLPDSLGADLATLIGASRTLNDSVRRMKGRARFTVLRENARSTPALYAGKEDDFVFVREQLEFIHGLSVGFAKDFRNFVDVAPQAYLPIDVSPTARVP